MSIRQLGMADPIAALDDVLEGVEKGDAVLVGLKDGILKSRQMTGRKKVMDRHDDRGRTDVSLTG